jgi:hypothetical protein
VDELYSQLVLHQQDYQNIRNCLEHGDSSNDVRAGYRDWKPRRIFYSDVLILSYIKKRSGETDFNSLHICNDDFGSFFCESLADCFSEARATSGDDCYLAFKAGAENFRFTCHIVCCMRGRFGNV